MEIKRKALEGKKFLTFTVIKYLGKKRYICICNCGIEKKIYKHILLSQKFKSCECQKNKIYLEYLDTIRNRIIGSIKISDKSCWEWQKSKSKQGYGQCGFLGKVHLAHRISWKVFNGDLYPNILVLHKCDNPSCVNPEHLFLGTDKDNVMDSILKNRFHRAKGEQHHFSKYSTAQIREARLLKEKGLTYRVISEKTGIALKSLSGIINRKAWKSVS